MSRKGGHGPGRLGDAAAVAVATSSRLWQESFSHAQPVRAAAVSRSRRNAGRGSRAVVASTIGVLRVDLIQPFRGRRLTGRITAAVGPVRESAARRVHVFCDSAARPSRLSECPLVALDRSQSAQNRRFNDRAFKGVSLPGWWAARFSDASATPALRTCHASSSFVRMPVQRPWRHGFLDAAQQHRRTSTDARFSRPSALSRCGEKCWVDRGGLLCRGQGSALMSTSPSKDAIWAPTIAKAQEARTVCGDGSRRAYRRMQRGMRSKPARQRWRLGGL